MTLIIPNFTPKQLADWRRYERVRAGGKYNMIVNGQAAADAARLSYDEYLFCANNYSALRQVAEGLDNEQRREWGFAPRVPS